MLKNRQVPETVIAWFNSRMPHSSCEVFTVNSLCFFRTPNYFGIGWPWLHKHGGALTHFQEKLWFAGSMALSGISKYASRIKEWTNDGWPRIPLRCFLSAWIIWAASWWQSNLTTSMCLCSRHISKWECEARCSESLPDIVFQESFKAPTPNSYSD